MSDLFKWVTVAEATVPRGEENQFVGSRKWDRPGPRPPDRLLILVYYGIGVIQEYSGEGASYWIDCVGSDEFCESVGGLPDGEGLWVFEGGVTGHSYQTYDGGMEYDSEFDGEYRRMTIEEQETWVVDGGTIVALWDEEIAAFHDEQPCVNCGEPYKAHTDKWINRPHVAVVNPHQPFRDLREMEQIRWCPTKKSGKGGEGSEGSA